MRRCAHRQVGQSEPATELLSDLTYGVKTGDEIRPE
jgi:hypothetical protein